MKKDSLTIFIHLFLLLTLRDFPGLLLRRCRFCRRLFRCRLRSRRCGCLCRRLFRCRLFRRRLRSRRLCSQGRRIAR